MIFKSIDGISISNKEKVRFNVIDQYIKVIPIKLLALYQYPFRFKYQLSNDSSLIELNTLILIILSTKRWTWMRKNNIKRIPVHALISQWTRW